MHPVLFKIGDFVQHTYGVLVAAAFLVGLLAATRLARREGLNADRVFNLGIYLAVAAFLGAKVFTIVTDLGFYWRNPAQLLSLDSLQAGGVFYGGLLAALGFAVWYTRRAAMPFLKTGDVFAPGVALGHAVGRLGCFASGCCWGRPTSLPWGVTFTDPYAHETFGVPLGAPLHPTQLYESFAEAAIFAVLLLAFRRKQFDGQILALYLALYGAARFAVEFVRDQPVNVAGVLTTSQFIALLLIALGAGIWYWKRPAPAGRAVRRPA